MNQGNMRGWLMHMIYMKCTWHLAIAITSEYPSLGHMH